MKKTTLILGALVIILLLSNVYFIWENTNLKKQNIINEPTEENTNSGEVVLSGDEYKEKPTGVKIDFGHESV